MFIHDRKKAAGVIVSRMKDGPQGYSDGGSVQMPEEGMGGGDDLTSLAQDFLHAVDTKSPQALADAFKAMFLACEQEPHDEAGEME